ncbi:putative glycolipid-binding domain-containing protein [Lysinibacillus xylanilyticus]|uniref:putative glycolipid-binding domain-containing protein n=1 Tax=Lysinibacillus xylanilyticus TaxID=582475 RepID=UPI002E235C2F|nr:putative glycolipid-binding domain-containing protein [Lysinibacillus xylanilyticus]
MNQKLVWKNEEQFGCEYFNITKEEKNFSAKGTIIYVEGDESNAHIVEYKDDLDTNWFTEKLSIIVDEHISLNLSSDGKGNWYENDGQVIDKLKGAIDIDISATPFSNSLPINRMDWVLNQEEHFEMVYISIPSLEVKKVPQSYKYINNKGHMRYFKYRCYDYETTICVDEQGLILDYPNVFRRVK